MSQPEEGKEKKKKKENSSADLFCLRLRPALLIDLNKKLNYSILATGGRANE